MKKSKPLYGYVTIDGKRKRVPVEYVDVYRLCTNGRREYVTTTKVYKVSSGDTIRIIDDAKTKRVR